METAAAALGQLRQTKEQLESSLQEECMVMEELQRRSNDLQHRWVPQVSGRRLGLSIRVQGHESCSCGIRAQAGSQRQDSGG